MAPNLGDDGKYPISVSPTEVQSVHRERPQKTLTLMRDSMSLSAVTGVDNLSDDVSVQDGTMDPKPIKFDRIQGRRPILDDEDRKSLALEGRSIRDADERDGTNAFLEAAFSDALADEPDYKW